MVLLGGDTQLVMQNVAPQQLHVVPVRDEAALNRTMQIQIRKLGFVAVQDA